MYYKSFKHQTQKLQPSEGKKFKGDAKHNNTRVCMTTSKKQKKTDSEDQFSLSKYIRNQQSRGDAGEGQSCGGQLNENLLEGNQQQNLLNYLNFNQQLQQTPTIHQHKSQSSGQKIALLSHLKSQSQNQNQKEIQDQNQNQGQEQDQKSHLQQSQPEIFRQLHSIESHKKRSHPHNKQNSSQTSKNRHGFQQHQNLKSQFVHSDKMVEQIIVIDWSESQNQNQQQYISQSKYSQDNNRHQSQHQRKSSQNQNQGNSCSKQNHEQHANLSSPSKLTQKQKHPKQEPNQQFKTQSSKALNQLVQKYQNRSKLSPSVKNYYRISNQSSPQQEKSALRRDFNVSNEKSGINQFSQTNQLLQQSKWRPHEQAPSRIQQQDQSGQQKTVQVRNKTAQVFQKGVLNMTDTPEKQSNNHSSSYKLTSFPKQGDLTQKIILFKSSQAQIKIEDIKLKKSSPQYRNLKYTDQQKLNFTQTKHQSKQAEKTHHQNIKSQPLKRRNQKSQQDAHKTLQRVKSPGIERNKDRDNQSLQKIASFHKQLLDKIDHLQKMIRDLNQIKQIRESQKFKNTYYSAQKIKFTQKKKKQRLGQSPNFDKNQYDFRGIFLNQRLKQNYQVADTRPADEQMIGSQQNVRVPSREGIKLHCVSAIDKKYKKSQSLLQQPKLTKVSQNSNSLKGQKQIQRDGNKLNPNLQRQKSSKCYLSDEFTETQKDDKSIVGDQNQIKTNKKSTLLKEIKHLKIKVSQLEAVKQKKNVYKMQDRNKKQRTLRQQSPSHNQKKNNPSSNPNKSKPKSAQNHDFLVSYRIVDDYCPNNKRLIQNVRKKNINSKTQHFRIPSFIENYPSINDSKSQLTQKALKIYSQLSEVLNVDFSLISELRIQKYPHSVCFQINNIYKGRYNVMCDFTQTSSSVQKQKNRKSLLLYCGEWRSKGINSTEEIKIKSGYGIEVQEEEYLYQGGFLDNSKNGQGVMYFINGDVYSGLWFNNQIHGKGIYITFSGDVYEGDFKQNRKYGYGVQKFRNADSYKGFYRKGLFNGQGKYKWGNGSSYEGDFYKGQLHGKGIWKTAQGDIYQGDFLYDQKHGYGIYRWKNGLIYEGQFRNGFKFSKTHNK